MFKQQTIASSSPKCWLIRVAYSPSGTKLAVVRTEGRRRLLDPCVLANGGYKAWPRALSTYVMLQMFEWGRLSIVMLIFCLSISYCAGVFQFMVFFYSRPWPCAILRDCLSPLPRLLDLIKLIKFYVFARSPRRTS